MTYTNLEIESTESHTQALCSEQRLLNTVLESSLKKLLWFSLNQHSLSIFSEILALKKNKIDSTETILMESPKKLTIFYRNLKTLKKRFLATVPNWSV